MSYAIEVQKVPITLRTLRGDDLTASVFVHPVGHPDYRPESVGDRINDSASRFLPCEIDGKSHLVRLDSIAFVQLSERPPEIDTFDKVGALRCPVELVLESNDRLRGELIYEAEHGEARVSDMLNGRAQRFIVLIDGGTTYFVQRDAIDRVKL